MSNVKVITPGILTTVQDLGRYGYQEMGITTSGVMDAYSARIANALVGNDKNEALLEITFFGPTLQFEEDMVIAITGAPMNPKLDKEAIPMWESLLVKSGQTLSFGKLEKGLRAYLAFGGELEIPIVNGSKSTLMKSLMGGYEGRALKAKDELTVKISSKAKAGQKILPAKIPDFSPFQVLRVVLGPQEDAFTEKGIHDLFCSGGYMVTKDFDRMGIRLKGESLEHKDSADIVSDGTVMGSIQVPASGLPIILMADRQTTGGYTKIGTIITPDIAKAAQLKAMDRICFEKVSLEEAQEIYREYETQLRQLEKEMTR